MSGSVRLSKVKSVYDGYDMFGQVIRG